MPTLDNIRDRLGFDVRELAGAVVSGEIPLPEELVNTLIAQRLPPTAPVTSVHVQAQQGDSAVVTLVPRARFVPTLRVIVRVERQADFPGDPRLFLRWSLPMAGPLAVLAGPLLSHFKALPRGITLDGDRVSIDVREQLHARGLDDVAGLIRRLMVHSRPGGFVVQFEAGV
jgi:hypothetical protein